ncbi:MAG: flagellar assembly protein FliW [Oscillospiraceae bacterium]|nr:flagellar assembly protein FliW [Oscillospiraceae bacterium]
MIINSRDFGEIEVAEDELITFPSGVFAFEEVRSFALISPLGEDVYPKWLQSAEDVSPCFVVFDPSIIECDYKIQLESFVRDLLKFEGEADDNNNMRLLVIATVPSDFKKTTVNMKAPIIINADTALAAQVILNSDYDFKYPLYSENADGLDDAESAGDI